MSFLIDIGFVLCYYYCYSKIVKRLDEEFKILNGMDSKTDLKTHMDQTKKCGFYLLMTFLALAGLFLLNLMIMHHYMDF